MTENGILTSFRSQLDQSFLLGHLQRTELKKVEKEERNEKA